MYKRQGLGGGAASSMAAGSSHEELDFASVQRGNPEIQRRAQEVIDRCTALGEANPILSVHDVGAGGLSNAVPEIVHGAERGGSFELREAVSYTHLDVYKRQGFIVIDSEGYRLNVGIILCNEPVSYTHLDVYKRQAWRSNGQRRFP